MSGSPNFIGAIQRTGQSLIADIKPSKLNHNAKYFLLGGLMNGVSNGVFNAVMMLYVAAYGFDAQGLGLIFMMNPLSSTVLMIPAGMLADKIGKRPMIMIGTVAALLGMIAFLMANSVETFALAFLLIGVCNAAATVFTPLYSSFFEGNDLARAFSLFGLLNITAMSLGSLGGFIPPHLASSMGFTLVEAYRVTMIAASLLFILQNAFIYISALGTNETLSKGFSLYLKSRRVVLKICGIGLLANIAGGLLFSLFPYYLYMKFRVESAALGTLFLISNLAMATSKGLAAGIARRIGGLRSITLGVALSAFFVLLMPISPSFGIMTILYVLRNGTGFMSDPLLTSIFMRSISEDERSTANSIRMISMNGGGVVAPMLGGAMIERLGLDSPAYLGGVLMLITATLYSLLLRDESKLLDKKG
jgi:MFS family permease